MTFWFHTSAPILEIDGPGLPIDNEMVHSSNPLHEARISTEILGDLFKHLLNGAHDERILLSVVVVVVVVAVGLVWGGGSVEG